MARAAGPTLDRSSTVTPARGPVTVCAERRRHQKFLGSPSLRRAMMFFWISEAPAADGVDHGVAVGRLGPALHGGVGRLHPELGPGPADVHGGEASRLESSVA